MPFPFQIVQGTDKIMMVYEYAAAGRTIHMDKVPDAPIDTWMGHSVGRWEGQTLVVDVTSLTGQSWFDRAGNFQSETMHVVERYTPISADVLNYEVTIEDPKVYTRAWKMRMPLHRRLEKDMQLLEFRCVPFSEDLLYGDLRKKPTPLTRRHLEVAVNTGTVISLASFRLRSGRSARSWEWSGFHWSRPRSSGRPRIGNRPSPRMSHRFSSGRA